MIFTKGNNKKYNDEVVAFIVSEYINNKKSFATISAEQGISSYIIRQIYKQSGLQVRNDSEKSRKYTVNDNYFEKIDTEEKAYWLGFMYADGFIQNKRKHNSRKVGLSLAKRDRGHLEKFKQAINFTGPIHDYKTTGGYNLNTEYSRILITSDKMAQDLINHGCVEHKTDSLIFPDINIVPKEFQIDFIRGLIDGDGSVIICKSKDSLCYEYEIAFTGTKEMCKSVSLILIGKEIAVQKRHKDSTNNNYSIVIGGNLQVANLTKKIYGDATIFLDRKYQKYQQIIELEKQKDEQNPNRSNHYPIKVQCVETGKIYNSFSEAARDNNTHTGGISACISGLRHKAGNLHWKKVEEGE